MTVRWRVAGFCLGWESVTGKGKTCGVSPTHCLPLFLVGTIFEKAPCQFPDHQLAPLKDDTWVHWELSYGHTSLPSVSPYLLVRRHYGDPGVCTPTCLALEQSWH